MRHSLLVIALFTASCATGPTYIPPSEDACRADGCYSGGGDPERCGRCPPADEPLSRRQKRVVIDEEIVAFSAVPMSYIRDNVAAVGPGFTDSWAKTCTTTASTIVPSGVGVVAFECAAPESTETDATQLVAIGDSGIGDPAFATRTSPVICGSGCAQTSKSINARQAYCRSDTDDVVLYCWGIVATTSQP